MSMSGAALASLSPVALSEQELRLENPISVSPSRCYWLERGIPAEGLCGEKMRPNMPLIIAEAEAGNAFAAFRLGQLFSSGNWGVEQDIDKARDWYKKAADGGVQGAQVRMARAYELGRMGLQRNLKKAIKYYEMAVSQGFYPTLEDRLVRLRQLLADQTAQ